MRSLISSSRLFTALKPTTTVGKIIQFPILRMLIAIVFLIPALLLHNFIYDTYIANIQDQTLKLTLKYVEVSLTCLLLFKSYALYTQLIEKRKAIELSLRSASNEIISGFMLGAGLIVLMIILFFITGCIKITSTNSPTILLDHFFKYGIGSLIEEFLFTIIIFKLIEEAFGTWTALLFNALLFGFAHIFNDNATVWTSMAIAISNPIIVLSFVITRRIWMSWMLHLGWNYTQAAIFNMPNSGQDFGGYLETIVEGPEWFTGGAFGVEASYVSVFINVMVGLGLLFIAIRNDQIVKAFWKR